MPELRRAVGDHASPDARPRNRCRSLLVSGLYQGLVVPKGSGGGVTGLRPWEPEPFDSFEAWRGAWVRAIRGPSDKGRRIDLGVWHVVGHATAEGVRWPHGRGERWPGGAGRFEVARISSMQALPPGEVCPRCKEYVGGLRQPRIDTRAIEGASLSDDDVDRIARRMVELQDVLA